MVRISYCKKELDRNRVFDSYVGYKTKQKTPQAHRYRQLYGGEQRGRRRGEDEGVTGVKYMVGRWEGSRFGVVSTWCSLQMMCCKVAHLKLL